MALGEPLRRPSRSTLGVPTPPTAEGGLCARRTCATEDPVSLDGTILRVDPDNGAALPHQPLFGNSDPNARRIIAYGLRNPFRITIRPGTNELWVGDVGWNVWEEINRIPAPATRWRTSAGRATRGSAAVRLRQRQPQHLREPLQSSGRPPPYFTYHHSTKGGRGGDLPHWRFVDSGLAFFYQRVPTRPTSTSALFFADYSRNCIWVMQGRERPARPWTRQTFVGRRGQPGRPSDLARR